MALKGIRVVELAGLAPAPYCGMILADFGAKVVRVDRVRNRMDQDTLSRGKRSVAVNLKQREGVEVVRKLCANADVLIEPFRAGVMERLGLGPETLLSDNPRLIYARMTGFGQKGPWSHKAGHDINYISLSGMLSQFGRKGENPYAPINVAADFGGGGLMCALGVMMSLFERTTSGKGQVIDANMVDGSAYLGAFLWKTRGSFLWGYPRGDNLLDGGRAFYETYKTSDGKFISLGALEPQFFNDVIKGLGFDPQQVQQTDDPDAMKEKFKKIFLTKTRDEWTAVFKDLDACFAPILEYDEAPLHPHNVENQTFLKNDQGQFEPAPAPKLSRTPGVSQVFPNPLIGQHTIEVLKEAGFSDKNIENLLKMGAIESNKAKL